METMGRNGDWTEELACNIVSTKFSADPVRNSEAEWPFRIVPD